MSQMGKIDVSIGVEFLTGNVGGIVGADAGGNVSIVGAGDIIVTGNPLTHMLTISTAGGGSIVNSVNAGTNISITGTAVDPVVNVIASPIFAGIVSANTFETSDAAHRFTVVGTMFSAIGTDANIDLSFATKGTGNFNITTHSGGGIVFRGISTGYVNTEWHTIQAAVQTTDATPTNIFEIPLVNSLMVSVKALVNGFQDDYSDCVGGEIMVTAYRAAAGDIKLVGAPIINVNYTDTVDTSDIDAVVNIGTESLEIKVIGVAAQNWNWVTTLSYMYTISNV